MTSNLIKVSERLMQLADLYAEKYPEFYKVELRYILKKAEILMSAEVSGLGSQGLRDAECERLMEKTPEYTLYHSLNPEISVISKQMWIYSEISKNIRAGQFEKND